MRNRKGELLFTAPQTMSVLIISYPQNISFSDCSCWGNLSLRFAVQLFQLNLYGLGDQLIMGENVQDLFSRMASSLGHTLNETAACLSQHRVLAYSTNGTSKHSYLHTVFVACVSSEITPRILSPS
jgi:hypothetical protein